MVPSSYILIIAFYYISLMYYFRCSNYWHGNQRTFKWIWRLFVTNTNTAFRQMFFEV